MTITQNQEKIPRFLSVKQTSKFYPAFSELSLRWILFNRQHNGASSFVLKVGKKIVIDQEKFENWLRGE